MNYLFAKPQVLHVSLGNDDERTKEGPSNTHPDTVPCEEA